MKLFERFTNLSLTRLLRMKAGANIQMEGTGGLFYESLQDSITAFATGGQTNATLLNAEVNRVTTVATAGDSVKLPIITPTGGLSIVVINSGANPMQVFGSGTDTINDVATATGVSQMPNSTVIYVAPTGGPAGKWYAEGVGQGYSGSLSTLTFKDAISAAGTTQATGTQLSALINTVSTVASGTGVNLPKSAAGLQVVVINTGANPLLVYPNQGDTDTINGNAATVGVTINVGSAAVFNCTAAGAWTTMPASNKQSAYSAANNAAGFTATAAQISGAVGEVVLDLTGNPAGAANCQLPTVTSLVAVLHAPTVGTSYTLRIKNGANTNTWTVTTNTGWTLNGTMTIATGTYRDFVITLTSLTAATIQNVGGGATL